MRVQKKCPWCKKLFKPNHRLGQRQKCCGNPDCKLKQKNQAHRKWKSANKIIYQKGQQDWRQTHPDYWRRYRKNHPDYTKRNREQTKIRKAFSKKTGLQKRIDILQLAEKQSELWSLVRFAKENRSLIPFLYALEMSKAIQRKELFHEVSQSPI